MKTFTEHLVEQELKEETKVKIINSDTVVLVTKEEGDMHRLVFENDANGGLTITFKDRKVTQLFEIDADVIQKLKNLFARVK